MLTRFAPSPTGWLHLGHARAAREAFEAGPCLLRMEDIDTTRCRPEYTQGIYEDLAWLGFTWPHPVRVQSRHMADYRRVHDRLRALGIMYPSGLTRQQVAARTVDGIFRGEPDVGADPLNSPPSWRLSIPGAEAVTGPLLYTDNGRDVAVDFDRISDPILVRRDIGTSYFVACTHDDALQGITHVVRGEDLRDVTPVQRILQALLGWRVPEYRHHTLLLEDGRKLSKRDDDTAIREFRERGVGPEDVLALAG